MDRDLCLRESFEYEDYYPVDSKGAVEGCYCLTCEWLRTRKIQRVAVIGSRTFTNYSLMKEKLDYFFSNMVKNEDEIVICSGGAIGADKLSERWAAEKGYKTQIYLPEYDKYPGKVAPLKRNETIMKNSDMVVAFTNGSSGTANALKHAEKLNLPIRIVNF